VPHLVPHLWPSPPSSQRNRRTTGSILL